MRSHFTAAKNYTWTYWILTNMPSGIIQTLNSLSLPQGAIVKAVFYLLSGLTCVFAFLVVASRNVFHSVICFALCLIGVAGIYLYLDAEFLAMAQILVYVGAIAALFVFAVMLTGKVKRPAERNFSVLIPSVVSLVFLLILVNIIKEAPWKVNAAVTPPLSLIQLGKLLMSTYALPFEVVSIILLAALVGAVVIGKGKK